MKRVLSICLALRPLLGPSATWTAPQTIDLETMTEQELAALAASV